MSKRGDSDMRRKMAAGLLFPLRLLTGLLTGKQQVKRRVRVPIWLNATASGVTARTRHHLWRLTDP